MTFLVHINGQSYAVADAEVEQVEARILDATHAGGAFVELPGFGDQPTRTLISPASWVRIEKLPEAEGPFDEEAGARDFAFLTTLDL